MKILKTVILIVVGIFVSFPIWGMALGAIIGYSQKTWKEDGIIGIAKVIIAIIIVVFVISILCLISSDSEIYRPGLF